VTTAGLARMNMILHDFPTANILSGNTLAAPKFKDGEQLRTYDYVVANPPFSDKTWSTGLTPSSDPFQRFGWGEPPAKQGDYAYLLHIVRSLKSTGKGACILPHGVLFRGNAEAVIRTQLVRSGYLKGSIGLPANLIYGTGIPASILVLDKENATARKGIFMIDASKGFIKDGNKNRLRERDLHRIVDVFTNGEEHPGYSRLVPHDEIAKNDFNLNLPRYIDSQEAEDIQDIGGHLHGGIPTRDIDALDDYWTICPDLRAALFKPNRPGYHDPLVGAAQLKSIIHGHPQFAAFIAGLEAHFKKWRTAAAVSLRQIKRDCLPKDVIHEHAEHLLGHAEGQPLIDPYAVYQHLMDYWAESMQDDCYLVAAEGWSAKTTRILETDKKGKTRDKGWTCDLVPKELIVARYFAKEQAAIDAQQAALDRTTASLTELEEEHGGDDGFLGALDKIAKADVGARLREIKGDKEAKEEAAVLPQWLKLNTEEAELKRAIREADAVLDQLAHDKYPKLTEAEIQVLVVDDKWLTTLTTAVQGELDRVSQILTNRIRLLADRYATSLPQIVDEVAALAARVDGHLKKMESSVISRHLPILGKAAAQ
jgi:type I restriction enzyme M protein